MSSNGANETVNGSGEHVGEESLDESTDAWTCRCGSVNDPDHLPEDGDPDVCVSCGASAFDQDEDEKPETPTIEEVKAGLQNLAGGIATAQDIENAARAEEGLPPRDQELPLDFGPFNPDAALKAIFEKQAEIKSLQADYDEKKGWAKDAKDELDKANKALVAIIDSFKNRRQQALNPSQPYLREVTDEPTRSLSTSKCPWEREHPGQVCPICSAAQAKDIIPAVESEVHPEHEAHATVAEAARVLKVLGPLSLKLQTVNVFASTEDLSQLTTDDLNAVTAYAEEPSPMPPQLLARCCRAAEPGSMIQVCQNCEGMLIADVDRATPYPVNALVGFNCKAYQPHTDEPAPTAEPVQEESPRKPRSHAKKNRAKKAEPEQERKNQIDAVSHTRRHGDPKKAKTGKRQKKGRR